MSASALPTVAVVGVRRSPYQGLVPYVEADADWFFGRDEWREVIGDNLRAYRVTVLYGVSGVGKSSVLRAGLMRHLKDEALENVAELGVARLLPVYFSSWSLDEPLAALEHAVHTEAEKLAAEPFPTARDASLAKLFAAWPARVDGPLLLVLDQLEELFVYHERRGDPVLDELTAALRSADPGVHYLLSIREDALAKLDRFEGQIPGLLDHLLRLEHLDREAAREAIVAPLERWSETVAAADEEVDAEPRLVETVLDQVETGKVSLGERAGAAPTADGARPGAIEAPYLQLVLERLWEAERREGSHLVRLQTLERLGGATRIVRTHLDAALAALPSREQDVAGRTLPYLVTPSGTKIALRTRDLAGYAHIPEERLEPLVEQLTGDVRILRPAGDGRYEIYHDALAGPILDWNARWEERQQRRRERRRLRILGSIAGALILLAAGVTALAIWALRQQGEAKKQQEIALSGSLAGDAANQMATRPDLGMLLGLQAYATRRTAAARDAVVKAVQSSDGLAGILFTDLAQIAVIAVSPDERTMAVTGGEGVYASDITLLDLRSKKILTHLVGHTNDVLTLAFSPDGKTLASGSEDETVRLWEVPSGQPRGAPIPSGHGPGIAFTPDGARLAIGADWEGISIVDIATGKEVVRTGDDVTDEPEALAFSPDGRTLASGGQGAPVALWRLTPSGLAPASGCERPPNSEAYEVALSRDGGLLAWTGVDGELGLYDVRRCKVLARRPDASAFGVAFSPNGRLLATGGALKFWSVPRLQPVRNPLTGSSTAGVVFLRDGRRLVTAESFGMVTIRYLTGSRDLRTTLPVRSRHPPLMAVSSDGSTLAAADGRSISLWSTRTRRQVGKPLSIKAEALAFDPRGRVLAVGDSSGKLSLWDVRTGQLVAKNVSAGSYGVNSIAYRADGEVIASASFDSRIRLWDDRLHPWSKAIAASHDRSFSAITFTPDGRIAACDELGIVRIWNPRTRKSVGKAMRTGCESSRGIAISPDGRTLAAGGSGVFGLWDLRTHEQLGQRLFGKAYAVAFSPDGATLATAGASDPYSGSDSTLQLWDVRTRHKIGRAVAGYTDVAFSRKGNTLVSSGPRKFALWSPLVWNLNLQEFRRRICPVVGRNLTRLERDDFVAEGPYRPAC
jgi:WD40 repeat protein